MRTLKNIIGFLLVLPWIVLTRLGLVNLRRTFRLLGHVPFRAGNLMRRVYLARFIGSCGRNVVIEEGVEINFDDPRKLHIGENVKIRRSTGFGVARPCTEEIWLEDGVSIYNNCKMGAFQGPIRIGEGSMVGFNCVLRGPVTMGKRAGIAHNCVVVGMSHDYEVPDVSFLDEQPEAAEIRIGDNAWIGSNVVIVMGVSIGEHAVVGAGSVVTRDVPPYTVAAGNPARLIKRYDFDKKKWLKVEKDESKS